MDSKLDRKEKEKVEAGCLVTEIYRFFSDFQSITSYWQSIKYKIIFEKQSPQIIPILNPK